MLLKRKRSIVLLLVFIFTVSLVFSQLWMLMTRYDIEDVFTSASSNRVESVEASSRHGSTVANISAKTKKYDKTVDPEKENVLRHPDNSEYPTDELRNSNSSLHERTQINSVDDSKLLILPQIRTKEKSISDENRDQAGVVYLNRSSENQMESSYSSTTTAVRNSDTLDSEKNKDLLFKNKYFKISYTQRLVPKKTILSNTTLENHDLYYPSKLSNDSENVPILDISRDDFAADDLGIRGDVNQIPKLIESTTPNYPALYSARIKNYNHTTQYFTEDDFGAVSNFEPLVPLPTKSLGESEHGADLHKENNDIPRSQINVPKSPGINVVSMSLYGSDVRYTMGALRNAEMIRRNFPGWTLRVYTESAASSPRHGLVPANVIQSLRRLGAEIQYVMPEQDFIPPMMWRFLVADDLSVDRFIVRDTDSRLTARDAAAVAAWIRSSKPFHSIRDHPSHAAYAVSGGLWGGKTAELRDILRRSWIDVMRGLGGDYFRDMSFLNDIIWPRVKQHAYCSDSVSCDRWPNTFPFPVRRRGTEHVGQVYDEHDVGREGDVKILRAAGEYERCLPDGR